MVTYHQWEHHIEAIIAKHILDIAIVHLHKVENAVRLAC